MRLTTKIVLGIILSIFIGAIAFIVALSFVDKTSFDRDLLVLDSKDLTSIRVAPYHTVKLEMPDPEARMAAMPVGTISFKRLSSQDQKAKLFMSKELEKSTIVKVVNDTLFVSIDWQKLKKLRFPQSKASSIAGINYMIYSDNVDFINSIPTMKTEINGLRAQHIRVNSEGSVKVESCTVDKLESARGDLVLKNNKLKQLNLDLDEIYNWKVENCQIDEENLSGGKKHYIRTPRSETKALNWHPKSKDAKLSIELSADSARLEFK